VNVAISQKEEFLRGTNLTYVYPVKTAAQGAAGAAVEEQVLASAAYGANDFGAALVRAAWAPSAAVVHVATNAFTLTIEQYASDNTHKATLGTYDARTTDAAKFALVVLVGAEVALAAGDYLTYKLTQTGSGLAVPAGTLYVVHEQMSDEE
jgi:hypothetical protein